MIVETKFNFGDTVYFINDPEQEARMITGFIIRKGQIINFTSICGDEISAYDFELSTEKTLQI
jgi:hypothetical protein